jgi:beta-galactosidase/beta-glucuronidase
MESLEQLIRRDRNHPSVVLWSIANEPRTQQQGADEYFGLVSKFFLTVPVFSNHKFQGDCQFYEANGSDASRYGRHERQS